MNFGLNLDRQSVKTLMRPLSRVEQTGSLCYYPREFEKLGNRVQGWTQKALVKGLKYEIIDGMRFKLTSLKEGQLYWQRKITRPFPPIVLNLTTFPCKRNQSTSTMKPLTWAEMQQRTSTKSLFQL